MELRLWARNPRSISQQRLQDLKNALEADREMLFARPLLALPDGTVICGNQRLIAARELGWESIPVLTVELDEQRAQLWALRDNQSYGIWDEPALAELLAELNEQGVDLVLTGLAGLEIDRILAAVPTIVDPDAVPPLPATPSSQPGEIYELGRHRLACGDGRDPELLAALLDGVVPSLLWTDAPYGIEYVGKTAQALTIRNDGAEESAVVLRDVLTAASPLLAPSSPFYLCAPSGPQGTVFRNILAELGWRHRQTLIWAKNSPVLGHADYLYGHEEILYGHLPGPGRPGRGGHQGSRWYGGNNASSVFQVARPARSELHPTMKPVALIEPMLVNSSRRGEAVLDAFVGSGSTLVACERTGRRCLAVELDPAYCDVVRQRYQELTGGR